MRLYVSSIDLSIGDPSLAVRRYFLSQMSNDASWKVILLTSLGCILTTVFMGINEAPLELSRENVRRQAVVPTRQTIARSKGYGDYRELRDHNILCPEQKVKTAGGPSSRHF